MNNSVKWIMSVLWRWKVTTFFAFLGAWAAAVGIYAYIGPRYDAIALLMVGSGVGESADHTPTDPGMVGSLARIAETNDILREAAEKVGMDNLFPELDEAELRDPRLIWKLRKALNAGVENKTVLLKIRFRHSNPTIAADYANAISEALTAKQADLVNIPGVALFFSMQRTKLEDNIHAAAAELQKFRDEKSIYSVKEQQSLLLKRASELSSKIASIRGEIAEKGGEKKALTDQLLMMKPVTRHPVITGIVSSLGASDADKLANSTGRNQATERAFENDPPLLLVRVYQDSLVNLFKVNAALVGANNLESHLQEELRMVKAELSSLSSNEEKFNRLVRSLTAASGASENYAKKSIEEQISSDVARARLSNIRIVQHAVPPEYPILRLTYFLPASLFGAATLALFLVVILGLLEEQYLIFRMAEMFKRKSYSPSATLPRGRVG